jgi:hypothetical protein
LLVMRRLTRLSNNPLGYEFIGMLRVQLAG